MFGVNQTNGTGPIPPTCDDPVETENLVLTIYFVIIILLTVFGNLLVIAVVFAYDRLHRITNYFIVSLAAADLLYAALGLPFRIHQTIHNNIWCLNVVTCGVWLVVDGICSTASMCNLAAISIDRLIAIHSPFKYAELVSQTTMSIMLSVVWAYSLLWGFLYLPNWTHAGKEHVMITREGQLTGCWNDDPIYITCAAVFAFFVPLLVIITAYSVIFKIAITQAKAVAALDPNRNRRKRTTFFREVKATKTIAMVIGAFVVSWLPLFIYLLVSLWDAENTKTFFVNHPKAGKAVSYIFIQILPPLSSCVNPIIYCVFNSNFRSAFLKFLRIPHRAAREFETNHSTMTTSTESPQRPSYSTMMTEKSTS